VRLFESRKHPVRRFSDVAGEPGAIVAVDAKTVSIAV
jgi:methionyl-tRNA formyltransferase